MAARCAPWPMPRPARSPSACGPPPATCARRSRVRWAARRPSTSSPVRRCSMSKPERHAAALRYEGSGAPKVVAAGRGEIARRIIEEAKANGVPIRDDAALAQALGRLELQADVPEELWVAVAEALVWAHRVDLRDLGRSRAA